MMGKYTFKKFLHAWLECRACSDGIMCIVHQRWINRLLSRSGGKMVAYRKHKHIEKPILTLVDDRPC